MFHFALPESQFNSFNRHLYIVFDRTVSRFLACDIQLERASDVALPRPSWDTDMRPPFSWLMMMEMVVSSRGSSNAVGSDRILLLFCECPVVVRIG